MTARDLGLIPMRSGTAHLAPDAEPDRVAIDAALKSAGGVISQAAAERGL